MRILAFAFLLASAAASAQAIAPPIPSLSCPVGFRADQQSSSQVIWTVAKEDTGRRPEAGNLGVHVQLDAKKTPPIAQVELKVFYKPIHLGLMSVPGPDPTQTEPSGVPEQSKSFSLSAAEGGEKLLKANLLLGPVAYISRVKLVDLRYADGTRWIPSPHLDCFAPINHLLLVKQK